MEQLQLPLIPMMYVSISRRAFVPGTSHAHIDAIDLSGIDETREYGRAPTRVKVLNKLPIESTGFANTVLFGTCNAKGEPWPVLCADGKKRVLTFAGSHDNDIQDISINHIYQQWEKCYNEGIAGNASGNHQHWEIAEGWHYKKVINKYGDWTLPNLLHCEDIFWFDKSKHIVANNRFGLNGYKFRYTDTYTEGEESMKKLPYGYSVQKLDGVNIHTFKLNKKIHGIRQIANEPHNTVHSIGEVYPGSKKVTSYYSANRALPSYLEIFNKETGKPIFITNLAYFINKAGASNYGEIQGRIQGENIDGRPDQTQWMDAVLTNDMHLKHGDFASWEYLKSQVILGYSPAIITIMNGDYVKNAAGKIIYKYSPAVGTGKYTTPNTQTLLMEDSESIIVAVVDGLLLPSKITEWAYGLGVIELGFGDSGGSSYAYYYQENDISENPDAPEEPTICDHEKVIEELKQTVLCLEQDKTKLEKQVSDYRLKIDTALKALQ